MAEISNTDVYMATHKKRASEKEGKTMKFYCVRDKKRYKYKEMGQVCGGCTKYRCNAYAYAEAHGFTSISASMMGLFSRWIG